jgi:hypothetical protein
VAGGGTIAIGSTTVAEEIVGVHIVAESLELAVDITANDVVGITIVGNIGVGATGIDYIEEVAAIADSIANFT